MDPEPASREPEGPGARARRVLAGVLVLLLLAGVALMVVSPGLAEHFVFYPSRADPGPAPTVRGVPGEAVEPVTDDGISLHGWLWRPDPEAPVVLLLHGNAGTIAGRLPLAAGLVERDVGVLLLDYRGYGRSGGDPSEEGIVRDAEAAVALLAGRGVGEERIVLHGRSLGAFPAARLAADGRGAGLILESAFTSLEAMAGEAYPFLPSFLFRRLAGHFDVRAAVSRVDLPVLVIHGTADSLIPPEMGRELYATAGEPRSWHPVEGAGHNDVHYVGGEAYFDRVGSFVRDVVPAP